ncbi:MAG: low temperature requirement protein A [Oscillospiraceae bacterium]|nr:low temperature requirement protein A [Oscillospiraceae bacterium]
MPEKLISEHAKEEKKVEYLELVYDLIFVYIIGRNNALLHHVEGGFLRWETFASYALYTLAVIQIWNFSTFYINRYGKNGLREHIFLFSNMYLLYYMADGTVPVLAGEFTRYSAAWALILVNIGVQYAIELRRRETPEETRQTRRSCAILLGEAGLVLANLLLFRHSGVSLSWVPILFGIAATSLSGGVNRQVAVDFPHLTERAMLYTVLTFGEMIIAIAGYFSGDFSLNNVYFSLMAFLIVVGLLLSYGMIYNRLLDRERVTSGTAYMLLHVFLIFALNNITTALEFMREEEVSLMPKTLFLTFSLVLYYVFLFCTEHYAREKLRFTRPLRLALAGIALIFIALMLLLRLQAAWNIAVTVLFVYGISALMHFYGNRRRA